MQKFIRYAEGWPEMCGVMRNSDKGNKNINEYELAIISLTVVLLSPWNLEVVILFSTGRMEWEKRPTPFIVEQSLCVLLQKPHLFAEYE